MNSMKHAYEYLYENAGPVIKLEAANKLKLPCDDIRKEMLLNPVVEYWLSCTQEFYSNQRIHDSFDTRLENWMHKLVSFGIKEEDDTRLKPLNEKVLNHINENLGNEWFFDSVGNVIAASYLSYMGYEGGATDDIIIGRIEAVCRFAKKGSFDIYADKKDYPAIPEARNMHSLVKPEFYSGNIWRLPTVHDLFAFSHLSEKLKNSAEAAGKIDTIIKMIFTDDYQKLPWGYGLMLVPPNKYYTMGWSVKLGGYFNGDEKHATDPIVWETELMSHFAAARASDWFKKRTKFLESFKTDGGLYEFPQTWLTEAKDKYFVLGGHMGLGENRKKKDWRRIESTAWMMRILNNM